MSSYRMTPCGPIHGSIIPPGSKSITNRALVCAALADGTSVLTGALHSDDTQAMIESLNRLGIGVEADWPQVRLTVHGCAGEIPKQAADLFIGNSGTTVRFLTAMVALGNGKYRLDGIERMRERPIQDLLDALTQLKISATSEMGTGAPPVIVETQGLHGGTAKIAGNISSQYLSGLFMATPCAQGDTSIEVVGELVSRPYVDMTIAVMQSFGVQVTCNPNDFFIAGNQTYHAREYVIEPDASAASYFWAAAAITGGTVTVQHLSRQSLQGDVAFCECLEQMGCQVTYSDNQISVTGRPLHGIDVDMNAISDTVQTLAAVALFADGPTNVRGVAHNRHKETDRIGDLATELRKLGATVTEADDGLQIIPGTTQGAQIETYDDHRMAMSLALAGLKIPNVEILNPECTAKTYPQFFQDLERLISGSRSE
jgi:3-phosphoshikimate 1-carboxyvinyltransferase